MTSTTRDAQRVRGGPTPLWWVALVLVPLIVGCAAAFVLRGHVEGDLSERAERSLLDGGIATVSVQVDGRDVTAVLPSKSSDRMVETVRARLESVPGAHSVEVRR